MAARESIKAILAASISPHRVQTERFTFQMYPLRSRPSQASGPRFRDPPPTTRAAGFPAALPNCLFYQASRSSESCLILPLIREHELGQIAELRLHRATRADASHGKRDGAART